MIKTSANNNDKLLWQLFRNGDESAFSVLYRRNVKALFAYGKKLLPNDELIEDLVQELFIDLWQSRERLSDIESPRFYLFKALKRRIYKASQTLQDSQYKLDSLEEEALPISLSTEFFIIEEEDSRIQKERLKVWLNHLPVKQYEVLTLRYYQNFSYSEISDILNIHEQSVRNLITRALAKLKLLSIQKIASIIYLLNFFLEK